MVNFAASISLLIVAHLWLIWGWHSWSTFLEFAKRKFWNCCFPGNCHNIISIFNNMKLMSIYSGRDAVAYLPWQLCPWDQNRDRAAYRYGALTSSQCGISERLDDSGNSKSNLFFFAGGGGKRTYCCINVISGSCRTSRKLHSRAKPLALADFCARWFRTPPSSASRRGIWTDSGITRTVGVAEKFVVLVQITRRLVYKAHTSFRPCISLQYSKRRKSEILSWDRENGWYTCFQSLVRLR